MSALKQATLAAPVEFEGVGIHTGRVAKLRLDPAPVDRGRIFCLEDGTEIPATLEAFVACDRSTILGVGEGRVQTPEHLLSALVGLGIDNVDIRLTGGSEIPILDGSAAEFCRRIAEAGKRVQSADAAVIRVDRPISVGDADTGMVLALPADEALYEYHLHYRHPMLGHQRFQFRLGVDDYLRELAPARTFALWEEVEPLLARGMALGGSLENALVIYRDRYSTPLTVPDEPVRHKCLDLIGDFALLGARFQGRVLAIRAGHRQHVECAQKIWKEQTSV